MHPILPMILMAAATSQPPAPYNQRDTAAPLSRPLEAAPQCEPMNAVQSFDCPPQQPLLWLRTEYLLWWIKGAPVPVPLVATGSDLDPFPGVLGQPRTRVAFGGEDESYSAFSGLRLSLGMNLTADGLWSIEGSYFLLERGSIFYNLSSNAAGVPTFGRPFRNAVNGAENTELNSSAGFGFAGSTDIGIQTRFQGWEANFVRNVPLEGANRFGLILGFRSLDLNESLTIADQVRDTGPVSQMTFNGVPFAAPGSISVYDKFGSTNHFYGPQVGGRLFIDRDQFTVAVAVKLAMGVNQRDVNIEGASSATIPGVGTQNAPGGVLALTSNIGRYTNNTFSVVPEVNFQVGYRVLPQVKILAGYDFLYWTAVTRPGDTINRNLNPGLIPTDQRFGTNPAFNQPNFIARDSDFWAHGFNLGLQVDF